MNLTLDIGNTCAKLVAFDGDKPTDVQHMGRGEWAKLSDFCSRHPLERGIYSTVVSLTPEAEAAIHATGLHMEQLVPGRTPVPIDIKYATPATLGADRLAAVVGAYMKSGRSGAFVIDIGTCITYDFVNANGEYLGGNISPGPNIRLNALHDHTGKLPLVTPTGDTPPLGYSTETAIRSGVIRGVEREIESYMRDFLLKYPTLYVYLTGGALPGLHISEKNRTFADSLIVSEGLNYILQYNEEPKRHPSA